MKTREADEDVQTARYIESMLLELRTLSQAIEADFLIYLIEMAMTEASDIAKNRRTRARRATRVTTRPEKMSLEQVADLYFQGAFDDL